MEIRDPISGPNWGNRPQPAAPKPEPDLFQAADALAGRGYRFEVKRSSWWRGEHWSGADSREAASTAAGSAPLEVAGPRGERWKVAGPQDLIELEVFCADGKPERLDSPLLAAALKALPFGLSLEGQPVQPYTAYNALTADPAHPQGRVTAHVQGRELPLDVSGALSLAHLATGLGDGTGVSPRAANLRWLVQEGLVPADAALEHYVQQTPVPVIHQGCKLAELDPSQTIQEAVAAARQEHAGVAAALGERTAQFWDHLQADRARPLEERLQLARVVARPEHYPLVLKSARPEEDLAEAAGPLNELLGTQPRAPWEALSQAYRDLRAATPEQRPDFLQVWALAGDPNLAKAAASEPALVQAAQQLKQLQLPSPELAGILRTAHGAGRLTSDGPLWKLAASSERPYETYAALQAQVPDGTQKAYAALPDPSAWPSVVAVPHQAAERVEAWKALKASFPDHASQLLGRLPEGDPVGQARDLAGLAAHAPEPEKVFELWSKLQESPDPRSALALSKVSRDLDSAVLASRWLQRQDLPCPGASSEVRLKVLEELAKAHQGDLGAATRDYLFVASRADNPEVFPATAGIYADLIRATGSSREARLAYSALEGMDPAQASVRYPTYKRALELSGSYAAASGLWDALSKLPPEEGVRRMDALVGLEPLREAGFDQAASRLAAGQLAHPLEPAAVKSLLDILGEPSSLQWTPQGSGWTQETTDHGRVWKYQGSEYGKMESVLVSSELELPADGICSLTVEGEWSVNSDKSGLAIDVSTDGGNTWTYQVELRGSTQESLKPAELIAYAGKKVKLRVRRWVNEGAASAQLELRGLKLEEVKTGPILHVDAPSWSEYKSSLEMSWTSDWMQLDSSPAQFRQSVMFAMRDHRNKLYLEIQPGPNDGWRELTSFWSNSYQHDGREVDLSAYAGKRVRMRYRVPVVVPGKHSYDHPDVHRYAGTIVPRRADQSGGLRLNLYSSQGVDGDQLDALLKLAFDPARDEQQRSRAIHGLARLKEGLGGLREAQQLWPRLEPHLGSPDFPDRCEAVGILHRAAGEQLEGALQQVESDRIAGEPLNALARLRSVRTAEQYSGWRMRFLAECPPADAPAATRFLGAVQAQGEPGVTEDIWAEVSTPWMDETLAQRVDAFAQLTRGMAGRPGEALAVWRKLVTWVEPNESLPGAALALGQLAAALGGERARVDQALDFIQQHQRTGTLAGVSVESLVRRLANALVLEPEKFEERLQELLVHGGDPGGVREEPDRVIVGGVSVSKRKDRP